jgi:hypothetical protein
MPYSDKADDRACRKRNYKKNKTAKLASSLKWKQKVRLLWQEREAGRQRPTQCEVCGGLGGKKGICFDHDHATGKFRGWICGHCNRALGLLKDNPTTLRALAGYLEK